MQHDGFDGDRVIETVEVASPFDARVGWAYDEFVQCRSMFTGARTRVTSRRREGVSGRSACHIGRWSREAADVLRRSDLEAGDRSIAMVRHLQSCRK